MTSLIERIPWGVDHADGYLLCLDIPLGDDSRPGACANHYDGIAPVGLESRLRKHSQGKGARLTAHARRAGIGWTLTRVWEDIDRTEERRLKGNAGMHWCPRCCTERVMTARDPEYGLAIAAAKEQYRATVEAGRAARDQAASKSAATRVWNRAVQSAHEQLQAARRDAAEAWIAAHPRPGLRRGALACVVDGTPVVTPPLRARQAVLDAAAAERANAWPDGFTAARSEAADPTSMTEPEHDPWTATESGLAVPSRQLVAATAWAEAEAG
jgi:hypothetical protein